MEDIIDIIVTETTNLIEITSQPTDEIIDVNIIDNREDVTLNVTPTVVEININSLTGNFGVNWGEIGGTLSSQTDLNTALGLKADLVGGKVPSSQLPSYVDDVVEVANYAALPVTGEIGKIYITLDTNYIYRWSGTVYVQILDSAAVWGAITGSLSSQSDLVTALSGKFNNPTGDTTQYIAGDGSLITFPTAGQAGSLVREVRNTTGATLTKGTIVYISGATGNKPTVSKAIATGDSTSAQTFGMLQADLANNANGYVVCVGNITGLDTSALTEGVQLYLSSTTAGTYTTTKQVAPAHLVYIGIVTRSHPTLGQIEVKIQNGYELDEIHDVLITSKANNDGLFYESSTSLWKNKSIATVLGYSPEQPLTFASPLIRTTNAISIQVATGSQNGYLSSTDWITFNAKQAALSGTGFVKSTGGTISYDTNTYLTTSAAASTYLALAGGTLTGTITSNSFITTSSQFAVKKNSSGTSTAFYGLQNADGINRWNISIDASETGTGNTGFDFNIYRYDDAGNTLSSALSIKRSNGSINLFGDLTGTTATFISTAGNQIRAWYDSANYLNIQHNGLGAKNNQINFSTNLNVTPTMSISGYNVGIGITPQGVGTAKTLEIGSRGLIYDNNDNFAFVNNGYNDGSWRYKQTGFATLLATDSGGYSFSTASSGSQASVITFVQRMQLANNGMLYVPGIYNNTNSNLPNVWVNSDGSLYRSTTSSQRFKENINDWNGNGLDTILALKPKTFKYKKDYYDLADVDFLGLIAEEVAEVSPYLAEFENQDRTGLVENVRYATIVVPLIKAVQEQQMQIQELKEQLANK